MLTLGFENVEELIFSSQRLRQQLPEFKYLFASWTLSRQIPALRSLGKRCIVDFLNELDSEYLARLEKIFGCPVQVRAVDTNVVRNFEGEIEDLADILMGAEAFLGLTVTRDGNKFGVTIWR